MVESRSHRVASTSELLAEVYRVQWLVISTAKVTVVELDIKFIGTTTIHLILEHIRAPCGCAYYPEINESPPEEYIHSHMYSFLLWLITVSIK